MKRAALVLFCSCALQTWTIPQPQFTTVDPKNAWARALSATTEHCGRVTSTNEGAAVVIGAWQAWNTNDGLYLTQCLVTLLEGDDLVRTVRVSFAARKCPLSDMSNLEALVPTCERADLIPDLVKNGLVAQGQKLEDAIRVKPSR